MYELNTDVFDIRKDDLRTNTPETSEVTLKTSELTTHDDTDERFDKVYKLETTFILPSTDISDIKVMEDGTIVIADFQRCSLVVCDIKGEQLRRIGQTDGWRPFRLDVVDYSDVVVSLPQRNEVMQVDIRRNDIKHYIVTGCRNVAYHDGELFVQSNEKINVITMKGGLKNTITPPDFYPIYYHVAKNGDVLCTARGKNDLICINRHGVVQYTAHAPQMLFPYGITTDSKGNILVVSAGSNNVHAFSPDGRHSWLIAKLPVNLEFPMICFYSNAQSIIIGDKDQYK
ncbi:unnamed protein product [Mytilus coruscus]|uniref:TRIM2_3 n=1 Tax=Mytilus coruscus TaxID=42192 RepID=A0A6J8BIT4_MYTCO|nr:unnamed protein product [Mytilus coruscus]